MLEEVCWRILGKKGFCLFVFVLCFSEIKQKSALSLLLDSEASLMYKAFKCCSPFATKKGIKFMMKLTLEGWTGWSEEIRSLVILLIHWIKQIAKPAHPLEFQLYEPINPLYHLSLLELGFLLPTNKKGIGTFKFFNKLPYKSYTNLQSNNKIWFLHTLAKTIYYQSFWYCHFYRKRVVSPILTQSCYT